MYLGCMRYIEESAVPYAPQILVIAVLMKWVLARTFSVFQWEALLLLVAGITVNQLKYCKCAQRPLLAAKQHTCACPH